MLTQTNPILPSRDIQRTGLFYQQLGFTFENNYPDYLIVKRDGQELHFFLHSEDHSHTHDHSDFSCYIRVVGLDALHAEFAAAGLQIDPPSMRSWGMKEMDIIDPDGTLLRFGERV
jgi:predicted enzyme related to lactoylglutathione lyase